MNQPLNSLDIPKSEVVKLQNTGLNYLEELNPAQIEALKLTDNLPAAKSALELLKEELTSGCLLSYNKELDNVLVDEVVPKRIVELTGLPGTGKSQICFQLCVTVQLPKNLSGFGGEAVYINTKKNFSSRRVKELAKNFIEHIRSLGTNLDLSEEDILEHIYVINVYDFTELMACAIYMETFLIGKEVKLVIIDGITGPAKHVDTCDRVNSLYQLFGVLQKLANTHEFAMVLTNDLTTRVTENESYYVPALGDSFFHRMNTRIRLTKQDNVFQAEIIKSPMKFPLKTTFCL